MRAVIPFLITRHLDESYGNITLPAALLFTVHSVSGDKGSNFFLAIALEAPYSLFPIWEYYNSQP